MKVEKATKENEGINMKDFRTHTVTVHSDVIKISRVRGFFWCKRKEVFTHLPKTAAARSGEALKCSLPNARCPAFPLQNQESQIFICVQHEQIIQNSPNRKKAPNCALKNSLP